MSPARVDSGFTLLEVITATFLVALVGLSIHRFVQLNVTAMQFANTRTTAEMSIQALVAMIEDQLRSLPSQPSAALSGEPHKFRELASDEIRWFTRAGNGLFTRSAIGDYRVTLTLQPVEKGHRLQLGLRRARPDGDVSDYDWLPLLDGVVALEIRYFDTRLNSWMEKWSDPIARPALVRLRIWRSTDGPPHEAIIALPPTSSSPTP
jgi:hypothetical protein